MTNASNNTKSHFMADKMGSRRRATSKRRPAAENPKPPGDQLQEEYWARNQSPPLKSALPMRPQCRIRSLERSDARAVRLSALPGCATGNGNPGGRQIGAGC